MPIYRLEPIEDFLWEQSWRHSLLKAICWVKAPDEDHARLTLASATAKAVATPSDLMESPWLSPVLTMCIEEHPEFRMEPEIAVRVDGVTQAWAAPPER
jgi:hypothetical protein